MNMSRFFYFQVQAAAQVLDKPAGSHAKRLVQALPGVQEFQPVFEFLERSGGQQRGPAD